MIKKTLLVLLTAFVAIQFIRPERNLSGNEDFALSAKYPVLENVNSILEVSCNDCHTNKTRYPWYANVQPFAWMLNNHVIDGKRHLNFSEFTKSSVAIQNHKFEEIVEMVEEKEMPLPSYTYLGLHSDANLSNEQRQILINWAKTQMEMLKNTYPEDSLKLRRRR